ncbi:MAG: T9SS type A sorting domain-containing protein [Flavobacteriales bacterium]|nr:T9SS type A sorting domain-containing protein [Flavobacteriales bacterium]
MKSLLTIVSAIVMQLSFGQSITDSLLIYYPFSSDADDMSGNGFNGIVNASLSADRFGNPNGAYSFNGIDEYIDLPNAIELKPELPVSFSFWVKLDDLQPENTTLFTTDFAQNNHSGVWMNLSSAGYLAINYGDAGGSTSSSNRRTKVGTTQLNTNIWYHVVGVVNGPTDMEIYIDCINDNGSYQGTGGQLGYTSHSGSLGRKDANTSVPAYYFMGAMDDFRYWNRELTDNDVFDLCNNLVSIDNEAVFSKDKVFIYPNPVNDVLFINVENNLEFERIILFNSIGQVVYNGGKESQIKMDHLETGVYFLQILKNDSEPLEMMKVVKCENRQ